MNASKLSARDISKLCPLSYEVYDKASRRGGTRYWDDLIKINCQGRTGVKEISRRAAYKAGLCLKPKRTKLKPVLYARTYAENAQGFAQYKTAKNQ